MYNINQKRVIKTFTDLAKISSPSWEEEEVINYITDRLKKQNVKYKKYRCGRSYNILALIKGNAEKESILFAAHTDTVHPCKKIKPIVTDTRISSDGTSILGSDNKAAIAMFLEAIQYIKENNLPHGDIELLFTCAEEIGLEGIKGFDLSLVKSKMAFIFDCDGKIGKIVLKSPYHAAMDITITGRAAHAGIEPEKGINAINVLAEIITKLPSGRLDKETTLNIGVINGGEATNIVAETAYTKLEFRSISNKKLNKLESRVKKTIKETVAKSKAKAKIKIRLDYSGFTISRNSKIIKITEEAMEKIRVKPGFEISGGGSDTNIINKAGIKAVNLSSGMQKIHSTDEFIMIRDLIKGTKLTISIIESI